MTESTEELSQRLAKILSGMKELMINIGPSLVKVAHLRSEAGLITDELRKRGVVVDDDES